MAQKAFFALPSMIWSTAKQAAPLPRSGLCRVNGEQWLVMIGQEPLEDRIAAAAQALSAVAGEALEERYLPPAVRDALASPGETPGE